MSRKGCLGLSTRNSFEPMEEFVRVWKLGPPDSPGKKLHRVTHFDEALFFIQGLKFVEFTL